MDLIILEIAVFIFFFAGLILFGFLGIMLLAMECETTEKLIREKFADLPVSRHQLEEKKKLWGELSSSGEDPLMVIALIRYITKRDNEYEKAKAYVSSYYSQVKFLIWRTPRIEGIESMNNLQRKFAVVSAYVKQLFCIKPFRAIAFWLEARGFAEIGMILWEIVPNNQKSQLDLEIFGAPDFMGARVLGWVPFLGRYFKETTLSQFLLRADSETDIVQAVAPDNALIYSKIYALKKDEEYKDEIANMGLTRKMDPDKLRRIAKHLGMKSVDELFEFCKI